MQHSKLNVTGLAQTRKSKPSAMGVSTIWKSPVLRISSYKELHYLNPHRNFGGWKISPKESPEAFL